MERRRRTTKLVATVVILFAVLWFPIHFINLWFKIDPNFPRTNIMYLVKIIAHTMSYANSCVNPIVYAFLSNGFRNAFWKTFPSLSQRYRVCEEHADDNVTEDGLGDRTELSAMTVTGTDKVMQTDL